MSKIGGLISRARVDRGAINDLIADAWEHYKAGGRESIQSAFGEAVADMVIRRYEDKIRNGFSRAGLELPADLNSATILEVVRTQTGLEIDNLDPDAVATAVDRLLSKRVSAALQVNITSVFDKEQIIAGINDAVIASIKSGRASKWVSGKVFKSARRYMAFKNAGLNAATADRLAARARMKKYRETHKLVWVS